jgi:hypothetical protein
MNISLASTLPVLVALFPVALAAEPASAAAQREKAAALVKRLADTSFEVRQQAADELLQLGLVAEEALREGLKDHDPEVRDRCKNLLPRLLEGRREARFKAFLANPDDKQTHQLSCWARFSKAVGTDAAARELFVAIQRVDGDLLDAVDNNPKDAAPRVAERCNHLNAVLISSATEAILMQELALVLFLATESGVTIDEATLKKVCAALGILAERTAIAKKLQESPLQRKLLIAFLQQRTDAASLNVTLEAAAQFTLKETMPWGLNAALNKALPAATRGLGLLVVARTGDKEVSARIEPLLEDTSVVGTKTLGSSTLNTELRDVALAVLVQLNGQKWADYGFPYMQAVPGLKTLPAPNCLGFPNVAAREAALKKWKQK